MMKSAGDDHSRGGDRPLFRLLLDNSLMNRLSVVVSALRFTSTGVCVASSQGDDRQAGRHLRFFATSRLTHSWVGSWWWWWWGVWRWCGWRWWWRWPHQVKGPEEGANRGQTARWGQSHASNKGNPFCFKFTSQLNNYFSASAPLLLLKYRKVWKRGKLAKPPCQHPSRSAFQYRDVIWRSYKLRSFCIRTFWLTYTFPRAYNVPQCSHSVIPVTQKRRKTFRKTFTFGNMSQL